MDIVKRLRERTATWVSVGWDNDDIFDDAADEIERLREALEDIAKEQSAKSAIIAADLFQRMSRAALKEGK